MFSLVDRNAVVTGGLGRIGAVITRALAAVGAYVTIVDIDDEGWEASRNEYPEQVAFLKGDLANLAVIPELVSGLDTSLGSLDIWVNCAYPHTEDWGQGPEKDSVESWRRNVELQMSSYCLSAEHAAQAMASRAKGSVINVASIYGVVAPDFGIYEGTELMTPSAYSAVKGGIIAHSRYLASYYGRSGVRVNALCPGGIAAGQPDSFVEAYQKRTALGRMARADEIGPPAVFLASDAASYVTGAVLMVDGGWTAL